MRVAGAEQDRARTPFLCEARPTARVLVEEADNGMRNFLRPGTRDTRSTHVTHATRMA